MPPEKQESFALQRRLWLLRTLAAAALLLAWLLLALRHLDSPPELAFNTAVLFLAAALAFAMAITARRIAVDLERKLRLRLLVRNMELENMAMRDDLTRLFNRRYFFERLGRELESAKALHRPLAVIMIDLDALKEVNDAHGHKVGDQVLALFGQLLLQYSRATDFPARIGGDEFALLLPHTSKRGAGLIVERLIRKLDSVYLYENDGLTLKVTASFGVSGYPWGADDVDGIMQEADASMYAPKLSGKKGRPLEAWQEPRPALAPLFSQTALLKPGKALDMGSQRP